MNTGAAGPSTFFQSMLTMTQSQEQVMWDAYINQKVVDAAWDVPYDQICEPGHLPAMGFFESPTPSPLCPISQSPYVPRAVPMTRDVSPINLGPRQTPLFTDAHLSPAIFTPELRASQRALHRARLHDALRTQPLLATAEGQSIANLLLCRWYVTSNNFVATQCGPTEAPELISDLANWLVWLDDNIRVHRSTTLRIICIENIELLNRVYDLNHMGCIVARPKPINWPNLATYENDNLQVHALPFFMRASYSVRPRPHRSNEAYLGNFIPYEPTFASQFVHVQAPDAQASQPKNARQAAPRRKRPRRHGKEPAAAAEIAVAAGGQQPQQQDGGGFLHGAHAARPGEAADDKPGWEPEPCPPANAVPRDTNLQPDAGRSDTPGSGGGRP